MFDANFGLIEFRKTLSLVPFGPRLSKCFNAEPYLTQVFMCMPLCACMWVYACTQYYAHACGTQELMLDVILSYSPLSFLWYSLSLNGNSLIVQAGQPANTRDLPASISPALDLATCSGTPIFKWGVGDQSSGLHTCIESILQGRHPIFPTSFCNSTLFCSLYWPCILELPG